MNIESRLLCSSFESDFQNSVISMFFSYWCRKHSFLKKFKLDDVLASNIFSNVKNTSFLLFRQEVMNL